MGTFIFWRSFIHVFCQLRDDDSARTGAITIHHVVEPVGYHHKRLDFVDPGRWGQTLQLGNLFETGAWAGLRLLGLMILTGLLVSQFLCRLKIHAVQIGNVDDTPSSDRATQDTAGFQRTDQNGLNRWSVQAILVGLFAVLAAGWPFWITQLPLRMGFPQDRFSLPLAMGVCLLLAGLIDALGKDLPRKAIILGMIIALATGFHFDASESYREDWNMARDFFWQLTWRAPSVAPDTLFISTDLPFQYYEDDSLTAPLNWTFDPDGHSTQMKYMLYDLNVRYHNLPSLRL